MVGSVQTQVGRGIMRTEARKARGRWGRGQEGVRNALVATAQLKVHVIITGGKRWLETSAWDCEHILSRNFLWVHSRLRISRKVYVFFRYSPGFELFEIALKLKISGPCTQNEFQPQTHEKTRFYILLKVTAFFLPRGQIKTQMLSYYLSLMMGTFFSWSIISRFTEIPGFMWGYGQG